EQRVVGKARTKTCEAADHGRTESAAVELRSRSAARRPGHSLDRTGGEAANLSALCAILRVRAAVANTTGSRRQAHARPACTRAGGPGRRRLHSVHAPPRGSRVAPDLGDR